MAITLPHVARATNRLGEITNVMHNATALSDQYDRAERQAAAAWVGNQADAWQKSVDAQLADVQLPDPSSIATRDQYLQAATSAYESAIDHAVPDSEDGNGYNQAAALEWRAGAKAALLPRHMDAAAQSWGKNYNDQQDAQQNQLTGRLAAGLVDHAGAQKILDAQLANIAEAGQWQPADIERFAAQSRSRLAEAEISRRAEAGDAAGAREILAGNETGLDPDRVATLGNNIAVSEQQQARRLSTEHSMKVDAVVNVVHAVSESIINGIPVNPDVVPLAIAGIENNPKVHAAVVRMRQLQQNAGILREAATSSPSKIVKLYREVKAEQGKNPHSQQLQLLEVLGDRFQRARDGLRNDPLNYIYSTGFIQPTQIDWGNAESIQQRIASVGVANERFGQPVPFLTNGEIEGLQRFMTDAEPMAALAAMENIAAAHKPSNDAGYETFARRLAAKDPSLFYVAKAIRWKPELAKDIMLGRSVVADARIAGLYSVNVTERDSPAIQNQATTHLLEALPVRQQGAFLTKARLIYTARMAKRKETEFDKELWGQVIGDLTNGGPIKMAGRRIIRPWPGAEPPDILAGVARALSDRNMPVLSGQQQPFKNVGDLLDEIGHGHVHLTSNGDASYILMVRDPRNKNTELHLTDPDTGEPFVLKLWPPLAGQRLPLPIEVGEITHHGANNPSAGQAEDRPEEQPLAGQRLPLPIEVGETTHHGANDPSAGQTEDRPEEQHDAGAKGGAEQTSARPEEKGNAGVEGSYIGTGFGTRQ